MRVALLVIASVILLEGAILWLTFPSPAQTLTGVTWSNNSGGAIGGTTGTLPLGVP